MESKLTSKEVFELEENRNSLKAFLKKLLPFQLIIIVGMFTSGIFFQSDNLIYAGIFTLFGSLYIDYSISLKWIIQLNEDIKQGRKFKQKLVIQRIKKGRIYTEVKMDNGLKINETEFEDFEISISEVQINKRFLIEFSPKKGYVFSIKKTI